jgi:hypothetical protein
VATALDLLSGALRAISSLSPGEAVEGEEADQARAALNSMLAGWGAAGGMAPARTLESFSIAQGVNSRTVGATGQLATARPDFVHDAYLRDAGGTDCPLDARMTSSEYNAIPVKTLSGRPLRLFYDAQYPNGVIYFDRQTDAAYTLFLDTTKPVAQFSSLSATVDLPGEYEEGIKYLLAERLAPEYGASISADLRKLIDDAKKLILRKNTKPKAATFDRAITRRTHFDVQGGGPW